jgi:hypothetical protein
MGDDQPADDRGRGGHGCLSLPPTPRAGQCGVPIDGPPPETLGLS